MGGMGMGGRLSRVLQCLSKAQCIFFISIVMLGTREQTVMQSSLIGISFQKLRLPSDIRRIAASYLSFRQ